MKIDMDTIKLKNIFDYPRIEEIVNKKALFQAYDEGDDCVMFTVVDENDRDIVELVIYKYEHSFFRDHDTYDLLTDEYESITIAEHYLNNGNFYVCNSKVIER